jgi:hypothetical protein
MTDFLDDMLGKDRADVPVEASYKICVGERSINPIEHELKERASIEIAALGVELPTIFLDSETGELEKPSDGKPDQWAKFFDGRVPLPYECAELMMELDALVDAHPRVIAARRRIELARSLGPRATQEQYERLCKMEGLTP